MMKSRTMNFRAVAMALAASAVHFQQMAEKFQKSAETLHKAAPYFEIANNYNRKLSRIERFGCTAVLPRKLQDRSKYSPADVKRLGAERGVGRLPRHHVVRFGGFPLPFKKAA